MNIDRKERIRDVQRIFDEYGFGDADLLADWDGVDIDELSEWLDEEEFQTLLDHLEFQEEGPS